MGAANLVADALSMGIGDYLSERAEDEYVASEQRRELAELRNGKRPEKVRKLKRVYEKAGLSTTDAKKCVDALSTVDDVLVAHTMMARLQLVPPDDWLGEEQDEDEDEPLSLAAKEGRYDRRFLRVVRCHALLGVLRHCGDICGSYTRSACSSRLV